MAKTSTTIQQNCGEERKGEEGSIRIGGASHRHPVQVKLFCRSAELQAVMLPGNIRWLEERAREGIPFLPSTTSGTSSSHLRSDDVLLINFDTFLILRIFNYFRKYPADNSLFHTYPDNNSLFRRGVTNYFRKYPDYNFLFH